MTAPNPRTPCPVCHGNQWVRIHPRHAHRTLCRACKGLGWAAEAAKSNERPRRPRQQSGALGHASPDQANHLPASAQECRGTSIQKGFDL